MSARDPRRRDLTRPIELLGMAAVFAVFVGGMVILFTRPVSTRQWVFALVSAGVTFIVALVVLAMLVLSLGKDAVRPLDGADPDALEDAGEGGPTEAPDAEADADRADEGREPPA